MKPCIFIKWLFAGFLLLAIHGIARPQDMGTSRIVTGYITDAETGEPIPMANVYIANTTVGVTTGDDGNYRLKLPGPGSYELVVSHVGYMTVSSQIISGKAFTRWDIALKIREFDEIVISQEKTCNIADFQLFRIKLLGSFPSPQTNFIENEEDLYCFYNEETGKVKISCQVPIRIVNMVTGYRIDYTLQNFEHTYNVAGITSWSGYARYEELKPKNDRQKRQWEINRKKVYAHSLTHFIRALYNESLQEEGFLVSYIHCVSPGKCTFQVEDGRNILFADSLKNSKILRIHPDSTLLLTSFGKPVTEKEIQQQKTFVSDPIIYSISGLNRNLVRNQNGDVFIFPDGTFINSLKIDPYFRSEQITGLDLMLPVEYGLKPGMTIEPDDLSSLFNSSIPDTDSLMNHAYPEKIYLTTDRTCYAAGDTLWMSAWVLNGGTLMPTDKSRLLHVEFIAPDGRILRHQVLDATQGIAFGQYTLPVGIPADGLYRLRAYTRWSLNFGENYRFEKLIPLAQFRQDIWQGPQKSETDRYEWVRKPNGRYVWQKKVTGDELRVTGQDSSVNRNLSPVTAIDIQFLPEGGRWTAGFPCNMAFRAIASDGRGVNVEGEILDDTGEVVGTFQS